MPSFRGYQSIRQPQGSHLIFTAGGRCCHLPLPRTDTGLLLQASEKLSFGSVPSQVGKWQVRLAQTRLDEGKP